MYDQCNKLIRRTVDRLAGFAAANACPVYRLGDAAADPDKLPRALYVEAEQRERHGDREICDMRLHLRVSVRQDPAQTALDALQEALEESLDVVLDGVGVVSGSTTSAIADDFHVRTVNLSIFIIGEIDDAPGSGSVAAPASAPESN